MSWEQISFFRCFIFTKRENRSMNTARYEDLRNFILDKLKTDLPKTLYYHGREDFFDIGKTLYRELQESGAILGEQEWNELQEKFLGSHHYFTKTSTELREPLKQKHLSQIRELVRSS